jgi:MFS family permease
VSQSDPGASAAPSSSGPTLLLRGWTDRAVIGVGIVALAAGFGQFGLTATLGDVARHFGHVVHGTSITNQAGLSGTELGIGLAVVRVSSIGGLPLAGAADRLGRRRVVLVACGLGLAITAASAASPGYWWFVIIFALGRPLLSAAYAVAQVGAAEETGSAERASAVALVAAGYAIGAGATAVLYGIAGSSLGYRGILVLALVPLIGLPFAARWVREPDRFARLKGSKEHVQPVLGAVARPFRSRLILVVVLAFSLAMITGPANSFVFLYAQNVKKFPGFAESAMVVGAGILGFFGLMAGVWLADHIGRRGTAMAAMVSIGIAGILCYSGGSAVLVVGYILGIAAGGIIAPAAGAFVNELFPTSVRASVAGWNIAGAVLGATAGLVLFGAVADIGNRFGTAALVTFLPAMAVSVLVWLLPETRGHEPEWFWPLEVIGDTEHAQESGRTVGGAHDDRPAR